MARPWLCLASTVLALAVVVRNLPTLLGLAGYVFVSTYRERAQFAIASALRGIGAQIPRSAETFCRRVAPPQAEPAGRPDLERVHVVYASDAKGFPGLLTSLTSLSRNLADPATCTVHVISPVKDHPGLRELLRCFRAELRSPTGGESGPEVVVHAARAHASYNATSMMGDVWNDEHWLTQAWNWERIYLHEYFPEVRRVVWLDVDTIVQSDIAPLYRMRMEHALAGMYALPVVYRDCFKRYPEVPQNRDWWFNSGVLVIDLDRWRTEKLVTEVEKAAALTQGCYADQLAINLALRGRFDLLPWSWNVAGLGLTPLLIAVQPCLEHADILHFSGEIKPWMKRRSTWGDHLIRPYSPRARCPALPDDVSELYGGG